MVNNVSWNGATDTLEAPSPAPSAANETAFEQSIQDFLSGSGSQASGQPGGSSAAVERDLVNVLQTLIGLLEGTSASPSSHGTQSADAAPTGTGSSGTSPAAAGPATGSPAATGPEATGQTGTGSPDAAATTGSPGSATSGAVLGNPSNPQSLIDPDFNDGPAPKPLNGGGQDEQGPPMGPIGPEDPTNHEALDGPLKGIKYGAELTAAANANGLSPYLLAGDAAVESGDNVDGKLGGSDAANGGLLQVNPGVWNAPSNVAEGADMGARIIRMYIDQAGGNVAKGLDGYNTGDINQSGYAAGYSSYAAGVLAGAGNAFRAEQAGDAALLNNGNA